VRDPEAEEGEEEGQAEASAETYAEHSASAAHRARAWQARKYLRAFRRHVAAPAALLGAAREVIVVLAIANDFNVNGNVVSAGAGAQQAQAAENAAEAEGDDVNDVAIQIGKVLALLEGSSTKLNTEANLAKASRAWAKVRREMIAARARVRDQPNQRAHATSPRPRLAPIGHPRRRLRSSASWSGARRLRARSSRPCRPPARPRRPPPWCGSRARPPRRSSWPSARARLP
jgi:hypothetical protein